ncbi:MAG: phosphomethylpyrimidine synthase ThiC, partial [Deltaproteobacteria bacterium]|nr:phosphomethylpyrimidine synthase ThiC [Deltaproteobacteria bacterium]
MSRTDDRAIGSAGQITTDPLPASSKVYAQGKRHADVRVAMREISLSASPHSGSEKAGRPLAVYDTSGPYTDPTARVDIRTGLSPLRLNWIQARGDVEESGSRV